MSASSDDGAGMRNESVQKLKVLGIAMVITMNILFGMRLATRKWLVRKTGSDDLVMSLCMLAAMAGATIAYISSGILARILSGELQMLETFAQLSRTSVVLYIASNTLLKVSLALFLLRFFKRLRAQRLCLWFIIITVSIFSLVQVIMTAATCGVVAFYFPSRTCSTYSAYRNLNRAWGAYNAATDAALPILCINALWNAKLKRTTKILGGILICFGIMACVASFLRLAILVGVEASRSFNQSVQSAFYTQVEVGVGIICANGACLAPIAKKAIDWCDSYELVIKWHTRKSQNKLGSNDTIGSTGARVTLNSQPAPLRNLRSAMSTNPAKGGLQVQVHDWREDRITPEEEIEFPGVVWLRDLDEEPDER